MGHPFTSGRPETFERPRPHNTITTDIHVEGHLGTSPLILGHHLIIASILPGYPPNRQRRHVLIRLHGSMSSCPHHDVIFVPCDLRRGVAFDLYVDLDGAVHRDGEVLVARVEAQFGRSCGQNTNKIRYRGNTEKKLL